MKWYTWFTALVVFLGTLILLPNGSVDWIGAFTPAARQWWDAPWSNNMPQPPWAALLLWPLALFTSQISTAITNAASVLLLARLARRWGGAEWVILPVLLSPVGLALFLFGQIDVLILAGLFLPEGIGMLVYILKPQVGLWIIAAQWRQLFGWAIVLIAVAGILSLVIWGLWPLSILRESGNYTSAGWNVALWPMLIPVGVWCVVRALYTQDERYGIAASPLLFPYVNLSSYIGLLVVLAARWPKWSLIVWGLSLFILTAMLIM